MRPKIIIPVTLLLMVVLALAIFLRPKPPVTVPPVIGKSAPNTNFVEKSTVVAFKPTVLPTTNPGTVVSPLVVHPLTVEELRSLAMNDDADSLQAILDELTNSDPEIRAAAREAAVQFGDRTAAPPLRAVAAQMEDLDEKKALLEAADFLELPSLKVRSGTN